MGSIPVGGAIRLGISDIIHDMLRRSLLHIYRYLTAPIILLILFSIFFAVYAYFDFPSKKEIVTEASNWLALYGAPVMFLIALTEGTIVFNWYLPGTTIIFLGYVLATQNHDGLISIGIAVWLGLFLASIINYEIGKKGLFSLLSYIGVGRPLRIMEDKIEKHGLWLFLLAYIHPSSASFAAAGSGSKNKPFIHFLFASAFSVFVWNAVWLTLSVLIGPIALKLVEGPILLGILIFWIILATVMYAFKNEESGANCETTEPKNESLK